MAGVEKKAKAAVAEKGGERAALTKTAQTNNAKSKATKSTITIRLKRGTIACNPIQRATIAGLGLKQREQVRTLENTPCVRGMIKKVFHLVEVVAETR